MCILRRVVCVEVECNLSGVSGEYGVGSAM